MTSLWPGIKQVPQSRQTAILYTLLYKNLVVLFPGSIRRQHHLTDLFGEERFVNS